MTDAQIEKIARRLWDLVYATHKAQGFATMLTWERATDDRGREQARVVAREIAPLIEAAQRNVLLCEDNCPCCQKLTQALKPWVEP